MGTEAKWLPIVTIGRYHWQLGKTAGREIHPGNSEDRAAVSAEHRVDFKETHNELPKCPK